MEWLRFLVLDSASPDSLVAQSVVLMQRMSAAELPLEDAVAEAISLAMACHEHMFTLADLDRRDAVEHAWAGASLIQLVQSMQQPQPDWLTIHEEQCCRYGAAWIHGFLECGLPCSSHDINRALILLERLEQLHSEPIDWLYVHRSNLEAAFRPRQPAKEPEPDSALGDCSPPMPSAMRDPGAIPYLFLDPRHHFQSHPRQSPPFQWFTSLHTYSITSRPFSNAIVLPSGVVTDQGWLADCIQYLPPGWTQASWMQDLSGYRLCSDQHHVWLLNQHNVSEQKIDGEWCVLNDLVAHRNLGHFVHDLLPQLMAIRRLREIYPDLRVMGIPERYPNLALLREIMIPNAWKPRPSPLPMNVERLFVQPLAFNGGIGFHGKPGSDWWLALPDLQDGLQFLKDALAPDPAAVWRGHWVFFSRDLGQPTEAPQGRAFTNYPQLIEKLSNVGVLVVDPGCHDIRQLQSIIAEAKGFIGIHGAGMFNALFGAEGARFIEIRPACGCWRSLELMALAARLEWRTVSCTASPEFPDLSVIPIDEVLSLLD